MRKEQEQKEREKAAALWRAAVQRKGDWFGVLGCSVVKLKAEVTGLRSETLICYRLASLVHSGIHHFT